MPRAIRRRRLFTARPPHAPANAGAGEVENEPEASATGGSGTSRKRQRREAQERAGSVSDGSPVADASGSFLSALSEGKPLPVHAAYAVRRVALSAARGLGYTPAGRRHAGNGGERQCTGKA